MYSRGRWPGFSPPHCGRRRRSRGSYSTSYLWPGSSGGGGGGDDSNNSSSTEPYQLPLWRRDAMVLDMDLGAGLDSAFHAAAQLQRPRGGWRFCRRLWAWLWWAVSGTRPTSARVEKNLRDPTCGAIGSSLQPLSLWCTLLRHVAIFFVLTLFVNYRGLLELEQKEMGFLTLGVETILGTGASFLLSQGFVRRVGCALRPPGREADAASLS